VYEFSFDQVNLGLASAFMVLLYLLLGLLALAVRNLIGPEGGVADVE
jgi:ABC-type sugar transport system permease subunit